MEDNIIDNLIKTEEDFINANNSLINIQEEYLDIMNNTETISFLNTDNIYFYFVLLGLVFLVFSLWFLRSALRQKELIPEIKKDKEIKKETKEVKRKRRKAIKIKVVKIK